MLSLDPLNYSNHMSTICLVIAIVFFALLGLKADAEILHHIDVLGVGLFFFAISFLDWADIRAHVH